MGHPATALESCLCTELTPVSVQPQLMYIYKCGTIDVGLYIQVWYN